MRGRLERSTWHYDPSVYAPPRYRKACSYDAFIPDPIAGFAEPLSSETAAAVSDAETAIQGERNRAWEASGLLDLLAGLKAGQPANRQAASHSTA